MVTYSGPLAAARASRFSNYGLPRANNYSTGEIMRRVAEREGFEPPVRIANNSFRGYRLQPLGHLSKDTVRSLRSRVQSVEHIQAIWFTRHFLQSRPRCGLKEMAEREGFEPSIHFLSVYSLSRRAPSADSAISPQKSSVKCRVQSL
jgi:hypothetical protein